MQRFHQNHPRTDQCRAKCVRRQFRAAGSPCDCPSGFTLVEMLVSVALVVIMMSMFATVFELAAGAVGTQRGIAENDQRARTVVTVIRSDLNSRSFRIVTPFGANEEIPKPGDPDFSVRDFGGREGFFYISENNLNDGTDDVLHFTVQLNGTSNDMFYGKARTLADLAGFPASNEPDRDDGRPLPDTTSVSHAAEIAIFMRNGRLYRRVLLLRKPLSGDSVNDVQPTTGPANGNVDYFDPANDGEDGLPEPYIGNFWNDFDFSAHYGANDWVEFHGIADLKNDGTGGRFPLGNPKYRFGHNQVNGLPREFVGRFDIETGSEIGTGNDAFIGRFTHEETSFAFFQYPQALSQDSGGNPINDGNPMLQNPSSRRLNLVLGTVTDTSTFSSISEPGIVFSGPRRAEDLLLANVHAFDVKVWDEVMQQFVDVGHNLFFDDDEDGFYDSGVDIYGDFNRNRNQNNAYGPNGPSGNNVFDTWHPKFDSDNADDDDNDETGCDNPPYRPSDASTNFPKPLRAIQITIRYFDISSGQFRQVTQQIALTD